MKDFHRDDEGLGIILHIGFCDLSVSGVHNTQTREINQHHVLWNTDVSQINFRLVDEEDIGVVFRHVLRQFIEGDFFGRPCQVFPALNQRFEFIKEFLFVEASILSPLPLDIATQAGKDLTIPKAFISFWIGSKLF